MTYTIAVTGKGGTGKTTLTGFLVDYLGSSGKGPILAVDADANSNLNEVLGVPVEVTLGSLREKIANAEFDEDDPIPPSITKQDYLNSSFCRALTEEDEYDLLVMGRTQGRGCYCFVNGLLQAHISRFSANYRYVVVDNEAGMEHLSRGTLPKVDLILLISDCSVRGIQAAARIKGLVKELNMTAGDIRLIVNKVPEGKPSAHILDEISAHGLDLAGVVPADPMVFDYDASGKPTASLPGSSDAKTAFDEILKGILP